MKLPLRTATTRRSFGPAPAIVARQLLVAARDGGLVEKNPDAGRASQNERPHGAVAATVAPGAA